MNSSIYLAIDSSTDNAGLAIVRDGGVLAELSWRCGQNHSVELMPNLNRLLEKNDIDIKSVSGVIVARGPGSFNGLRVGVSTAKGLAFGLGAPIVGVSTLEAAAWQHAGTGLPICPILNAGRGEIATATYQQKEGEWKQITAEHISTVKALCRETKGKAVFCGEPTSAIIEDLTERLGEKAVIPPSTKPRRAVFLAELGLKRLLAGDCDQPSTLQPVYLRRPQITQPKNKSWAPSPANKPENDAG